MADVTTTPEETTPKNETRTKKSKKKNKQQAHDAHDQITQIASETAERVAEITGGEEDIIVTIEEVPPGDTGSTYSRGGAPVPLEGLMGLTAVPLTFARATVDFWGSIMGTMLDYQTRMFEQSSRELVRR